MRLATRFGWTVPEIMALSVLQVDEITRAMNACDEVDAAAQARAAKEAGY